MTRRKRARQREREQPDAGVEVERGLPFQPVERGFHQLVVQEPIHLEKRVAAHAEPAL